MSDDTRFNPAQVTDAMVDDAIAKFLNDPEWTRGIGIDDKRRRMRAALTAAISAGGQAVVVKPLKWSDESWGWQAFPEIGEYRVEDQGLNWNVDRFWTSYRCEILGKFADSDDALAAAQADYERRIISALSQPHPADERVVEALRKAASNIVPYLEWTISDESPGHHPTMPSAVGAFIASFWGSREGYQQDRIRTLSVKEGR